MNDIIRKMLTQKEATLNRLVPVEKLAGRVRGTSVERIRDLAEAGYIPHWRVDGGEMMFDAREVRKWVEDNLVTYNPGKALPTHFCLTADVEYTCEGDQLPIELRNIFGLTDVTGILSLQSGVYFLCLENRVVYVGQSRKASHRVLQHVENKDFDRVLFLRWPAFDLDRAEGAMIRLLRPPLNAVEKKVRERLHAPGLPENDQSLLSQLMIPVRELPN